MYYFGKRRPYPVYDDITPVDTPVDEPCAHCGEPFVDGDDGFVVPRWPFPASDGWPFQTSDGGSFHRTCFLRLVTGSLAHLERRCSCYVPGSTCTDPPELTKRQAAEAAVRAMEARLS